MLLSEAKPLSAYEIADQLQSSFTKAVPAMSVYRMLDFLMAHGLVHRLSCSGKYLACSHIGGKHNHPLAQFLICDQCGRVQEQEIDGNIMRALADGVGSAGFKLKHEQIELHCICNRCER